MMPKSKCQNIFTAVFPFYLTLKFFGLFPGSFDGDCSYGIFRVNWFDRIMSAIALAVLMFGLGLFTVIPDRKFSDATLVNIGWQVR